MMHDPKGIHPAQPAASAAVENLRFKVSDGLGELRTRVQGVEALIEAICHHIEEIEGLAKAGTASLCSHILGRAETAQRLAWLALQEASAASSECTSMQDSLD